jgi:hypothetical protein
MKPASLAFYCTRLQLSQVVIRALPRPAESRMSSRVDEYARVIRLLERDVVATVGEAHRGCVHRRAAEVSTLDLADPEAKLVDDVQQILHDTHVDTTWPTCPHHSRHPLWYRDGGWWCEQLEERVFPLGALPPATP